LRAFAEERIAVDRSAEVAQRPEWCLSAVSKRRRRAVFRRRWAGLPRQV